MFQAYQTALDKKERIEYEQYYEKDIDEVDSSDVEFASDDENNQVQNPDLTTQDLIGDSTMIEIENPLEDLGKKKPKKGKKWDAEFTEQDLKPINLDEEEAPMDLCEPEQIDDPSEAIALARKKLSAISRRHRSEVDEANLEQDETHGLTIYIDNLPNHPDDIEKQILDVQEHIMILEEKWFQMEQSDEEDPNLDPSILNSPCSIDLVKGKSHIAQHFCIPCSVDVRTFDFDKLINAQMNTGGRLFDVITMDPPW